ncbi:MAG: radical SAM protein [Planctomycetota bacterium]
MSIWIGLLITRKCTSRCKHCDWEAGPEREGLMSVQEAETYLKEAIKVDKPDRISISGGEPLIYFERVIEIANIAHRLGYKVGIFTNFSWAKSPDIAYKRLSQLKENGITFILTSADAFHQEYVPIDCVCNGLLAAKEVGFEYIRISHQHIDDKCFYIKEKNSLNETTKQIIKKIESLDLGAIKSIVKMPNKHTRISSRARNLVDSSLLNQIPSTFAEAIEFVDDSIEKKWPNILRDFFIVDSGLVHIEPSTFVIGNAKEQPLSEMIRYYDHSSHPLVVIMKEKGVKGLLEIAEQKGVKLSKKYFHMRDLVYDILLDPEIRKAYSVNTIQDGNKVVPLIELA